MKSYKHCPIFESIEGQKQPVANECEVCPFSADCPEDLLNDAVSKILKQIGEYIVEKVSPGRVG